MKEPTCYFLFNKDRGVIQAMTNDAIESHRVNFDICIEWPINPCLSFAINEADYVENGGTWKAFPWDKVSVAFLSGLIPAI
jgi:hypothetical protein